MFNQYKGEVRALIKNIIQLTYFMRGSIQYEEMMNRTYAERQMIGEFVEERLKVEAKKPHPVY